MLDAKLIEGFSSTFFLKNYDGSVDIPEFHRELWDLCCSDDQYVAIAAPRGHAKSTSIGFAYALAELLFRSSDHLLIVSDTSSQSESFLGSIKEEIKENDKLRALFKIQQFEKESESEIIVRFQDGHKFRAVARGAGQSLRGVKWGRKQKRPNLVICDDMDNDETVLNKDRRDKFKKWFLGALKPILSDNGKIRIVGTILHLDSLLEGLMPENQIPSSVDKSQYLVNEPCKTYSTYPGAIWKSVRYRAHDSDFKNILWEERFSEKKLRELQQDYTARGFPEGYAQEYLNYPIDESTAYFRKQDFLPIQEKEHLNYYVGVDFALSQKSKADFTVFAVIAITSTGRIQVTDIRRGRWDADRIGEEFISIQKRYNPDTFFVEKGVIWLAVQPIVNRLMQETGVYLTYDEVPVIGDKMARARPLQQRMRAGVVEFDTEAEWFQGLQQEMLRFPKDVHDDQVDALAHPCLALQKLAEAPTDREIYEEDLEEAWEEAGALHSSKSFITGY